MRKFGLLLNQGLKGVCCKMNTCFSRACQIGHYAILSVLGNSGQKTNTDWRRGKKLY